MNSDGNYDILCNKLFQALDLGDTDRLSKLVNENDIYITNYYDSTGSSLLVKSVFMNLTDITILILEIAEKQISNNELIIWIDKRNNSGFNALHYACFRGNIKLIKKLISIGADVSITNKNGLNIMHMSSQGNQATSITYLQQILNIDVNSLDDVNSTPLHWASYMDAENAFNYLIQMKANINTKDKDGSTPLHLAVMNGTIYK
jgi:ankyrin repeat protein